ncbi:unnamed protein product [Trichobilharzia szidati]|nr:unnamed protein product [Trichobilharzia szidati]
MITREKKGEFYDCSVTFIGIAVKHMTFNQPSEMNHITSHTVSVENSITILYGSQTGNAKNIAELLTLQAHRIFGHKCATAHLQCPPKLLLLPMNDYIPVSRLAKENGIVIFVCSTTGYGVPPDNMSLFWKKLMNRALIPGRSLPPDLRFAVLGLGDSSYTMFNFVAKKLYRRLVQLGATPLCFRDQEKTLEKKEDSALGLADDQSELGQNEVLKFWIPALWHSIIELFGIPLSEQLSMFVSWDNLKSPDFVFGLWPKYDVTLRSVQSRHNLASLSEESLYWQIAKQVEFDNEHSFMSKAVPASAHWFQVIGSKRVTSTDHFQETRLLELSYKYSLQSVQIRLSFDQEDVLSLFQITGLDPTVRVKIDQRHPNFPLPSLFGALKENHCDVSVAWLANYYFDLNATPQQSFFVNFCAFANHCLRHSVTSTGNQTDRDRLRLEVGRLTELALAETSEAVDDLYDYVFRPSRRVIEILVDFPVTASLFTADCLFDVLPGPIRARPYSIASPTPKIELLIAVVNYRTRISTPRMGLASNYLASLSPGDCLSGWFGIVTGGFQFDKFLTSSPPPCLLIATGTGIAPFRSFLLHQRNSLVHHLKRDAYPTNVLFFGCRYSTKDYYFSTELSMLEQEGWLKVIPAFSRENISETSSSSSRRQYVQDQMKRYQEIVWSVLKSPQSHVFIVSSQKTMPKEVYEALIYSAVNTGCMDSAAAEDMISQMEKNNRIQIEAWS